MAVDFVTRYSEKVGKRVHRIKVVGSRNSVIVNDEELAAIADYADSILDVDFVEVED